MKITHLLFTAALVALAGTAGTTGVQGSKFKVQSSAGTAAAADTAAPASAGGSDSAIRNSSFVISNSRSASALWKLAQNTTDEKLTGFRTAPANREFFKWLTTPRSPLPANRSSVTPATPLETYLISQPVLGKTRGTGQLRVWAALWKSDPDCRRHDSTWFNAAIGQALATAPDADDVAVLAAVERYYFTKRSHAEKRYYPSFEKLAPWEMRFIASTEKPITEVEWCQRYLAAKKPKLKPSEFADIGNVVAYRLQNPKGIYIYERERDALRARATRSRAYYDYRPETLATYVEHGGVCVEISTVGRWFAIAKGLPAFNIGQPSHLSFIWREAPHKWSLGNNIYGWHRSSAKEPHYFADWERQPSVIHLFDDYIRDPEAARSSCLALWQTEMAAEGRGEESEHCRQQKAAQLREGLRANPFNLSLWNALADTLEKSAAGTTPTSPAIWRTDALALARALRDHPYIAAPILARYTKRFLDPTNVADASAWFKEVAGIFAGAPNVRTGTLGSAAGYARFFCEVLNEVVKQPGVNTGFIAQIGRLETPRNFWKRDEMRRLSPERLALVDQLYKKGIEASAPYPTLAISLARSYYLASRADPARSLETRRYLENVLQTVRNASTDTQGALAISRLIILGAEEVGDMDAVALNTFYALQIQLDAAPTDVTKWREFLPALIANASLSSETRRATTLWLNRAAGTTAPTAPLAKNALREIASAPL